MRRWKLAVFAAAFSIALALPAQAQWKWRDKGGQTQYSDLPPPPGTADQDILLRPNSGQRKAVAAAVPASGASAATGAPLLMPKASEPELEAKRRKAEQDEAAKKKTEDERFAAAKADNCVRARSQLRSLDDGLRMARTNDKGEREVLDDKGRAEESRRARDVVASDCR